VFETALVVAGLAAFAFVLPHSAIGDAALRYDTLRQLLDDGTLTGNRYTIVGHLFAIPLLLLARLLGQDQQQWATMYNSLLFAVAIAVLYLLLRRRLPAALLRRFFLVLIAASMFAAHVVQFNAEPFTALAVAVGLVAIAVRGRSLAGWAVVALGVANTAATLVPLAFVVARRMWEDRRLRYALAGVAAVAVLVADNWVRRGSPLETGYSGTSGYRTVMPYSGRLDFSYPIFFGLLSVCLSFGKGLLFFTPGLVLPVRASMRRLPLRDGTSLYRLYGWWLLFTVGLVLVYAPWWSWYGGLTWGPRFMLFVSVPASLALAVRLWEPAEALWLRALTLAVLTLSAWVGLCAAVFAAETPPACVVNHFANEALCHYTPEFSALWYPFVADLPVTRRDIVMIVYCGLVYCYLAAPLVRSIGADVARRARRPLAEGLRGWRW
jgi:hypothetical protein